MSRMPGRDVRQTSTKLSATKTLLLQEYHHRVRDCVKMLKEGFSEIVRLAKVSEESTIDRLSEHEFGLYEMQVRASTMVRSAEMLIENISNLRQFLVLNDFAFINEAVAFNSNQCQLSEKERLEKLASVKEDIAFRLQEAEQELYNTVLNNSPLPLPRK